MITYHRGNIFDSDASALVNTVNCVGVMGKGIAHQFARAFPAMYEEYVRDCRRGGVRLGEVRLYTDNGRSIINFPTKDHWRSSSKLNDIELGLRSLRDLLLKNRIISVAIPPLGCGNGGLSWKDVRPLIERELGIAPLLAVAIAVYEPAGNFSSRVAKPPKLSLGHFVLAALRLKLSTSSKILLHKTAYWFNVHRGAPYFSFVNHKFGPYAPSLEPMMVAIRDYCDYYSLTTEALLEDGVNRSLAGRDADKLASFAEHIKWAVDFCNKHAADIEAISTVHAVIRESGPIADADVVTKFFAWSEEKPKNFTSADVTDAISVLLAETLVERQLQGYVALTQWRPRTQAHHVSGDYDPLRH